MRILYGVQGTGNGHISRARAMLPALEAQGIEVDFIFSGRKIEHYFDMQAFGAYRSYPGFTFQMAAGQVQPWQTLLNARPLSFMRDVWRLNLNAYDCVLTDFEPISAWAAKRHGLPAIGLAHQYALRYPMPGMPDAPWLRAAITSFAPANHYLGLHWQPFEAPILPPLLQLNPAWPVSDEGFVLVYLPFQQETFLRQWLHPLAPQSFRIYAPVKQPVRAGHIEIQPFSRQNFMHDLSRCHGIISNSGFGLCSEALALGKKILTYPLPKHAEQQSNAKVLQALQRATIGNSFDEDVVRRWLAQPTPAPLIFPDVAQAVAAWLAAGCSEPVLQLVARVWQQHPQPATSFARKAA